MKRRERIWTVFIPGKSLPIAGGRSLDLDAQEVWHDGETLCWRVRGKTKREKGRPNVWEHFKQAMGHTDYKL